MTRYTHLNDIALQERLVERIRAGEESAFDRLFLLMYSPLVDFALRYVHEPEDAEEVVTTLLSHIWDIRTNWEVRGSVVTYLCAAVRNRALNRRVTLHADNTRFAELDESLESPENLPSDAAADATMLGELDEFSPVLKRALETLHPRTREVFLVVKRDGMSIRQAADVLGIAPATVQRQLLRAVETLKNLLLNKDS